MSGISNQYFLNPSAPQDGEYSNIKRSNIFDNNLTYNWKDVHQDLENNHRCGTYGADNAAFHGMASLRAGVDMSKFHSQRSPDEFYVPELVKLLNDAKIQAQWAPIVTIDPMGMFATRATQSACTAKMMIPELDSQLEPDDVIVNNDKTINCIKHAVDYVWNIPGLAKRCNMKENEMRQTLAEYTQNPTIHDTQFRTYLPPVGGCTIYYIGDPSKLLEPTTEVAVRVHDACCGSDVFGTDICTCRPYLVYAIQVCVEAAKRGGVGVIAYFKREGRSLGEVTKFRVYNARKAQKGGDTAENYFKQTESIAGVRDARFQEMMPDILLFLGIKRIDWLLSMSSDKYEAITAAGIEVMQRVTLPDIYVPKGATVEISAKVAAGDHTNNITTDNLISSLRSLESIRQHCQRVLELAKTNRTKYFTLNEDKLKDVIQYVIKITEDNYGSFLNVPYHSRWRHFQQEELRELMNQWHCDEIETSRRMIDLITVSVLLDAGAGNAWHYMDNKGQTHNRSEGLAVASLNMFADGLFSSDPALPYRVNALGLKNMTFKQFQQSLQVNQSNPINGLEGRYKLFKSLAKKLPSYPEFFGQELYRPGNIVDYVLKHVKDGHVSIRVLWKAIIEGFENIWPENCSGVRRGDVWVYSPLKKIGQPGSDMIPFHKLSQWLTYSMLEPIERLGIKFEDMELMTGLAEYRNGGLFIDMDVLVPKREEYLKMEFDVGNELIVEWRALTIMLLDTVADKIRQIKQLNAEELPLAKVLQGGTWAAGRLAAKAKRNDGSSPISVRLDGNVF